MLVGISIPAGRSGSVPHEEAYSERIGEKGAATPGKASGVGGQHRQDSFEECQRGFKVIPMNAAPPHSVIGVIV